MSSPLQQVEYVNNQAAQSNFQSHYDLEDPANAVASYMKSLHKYTKSQMDSVKRSANRRTEATGTSQLANLTPESSVDSTESRRP
ncbi:MAG: hypothetical protein Q9218_002730 [Villophora microphyllina]